MCMTKRVFIIVTLEQYLLLQDISAATGAYSEVLVECPALQDVNGAAIYEWSLLWGLVDCQLLWSIIAASGH